MIENIYWLFIIYDHFPMEFVLSGLLGQTFLLLYLTESRNTCSLWLYYLVLQKENFQMYSVYCQNKPKSEALRREVGDNNAFFKV